MTKEELKNIRKMPFSKVCKLCGKESIYILSRIISCSNCPLFRNKCIALNCEYTLREFLEDKKDEIDKRNY